jgi:hypothetical protein
MEYFQMLMGKDSKMDMIFRKKWIGWSIRNILVEWERNGCKGKSSRYKSRSKELNGTAIRLAGRNKMGNDWK